MQDLKDSVLQSMVTRFVNGHALDEWGKDRQFEAFVAHMVIRRYHQEYHDELGVADVENFLVGGTDDAALDAIGIFIDGVAVHTEDDVNDVMNDVMKNASQESQTTPVQYVFVQAKRSPKFDSGGIGKFTRGARWFCQTALDLGRSPDLDISRYSESVQDRVRLAGYIQHRFGADVLEPTCFLYYASSGIWHSDSEPALAFEDGRRELEQSSVFDLTSVHAMPLGRDDLKAIYRYLGKAVAKLVKFHDAAEIPTTSQVDGAYVGVVAGDEFVRLISTNTGDLDRRLFYDNVRDFQVRSDINKAIAETLTRAGESFPFLNNGITIVAHSASVNQASRNFFHIRDFQIVNGCQTSYVLFNNRDKIDDRTFVPVKLIITTERDLVTEIIRGTNSQTPIDAEALRLLTQFHIELEDFYKAEESNRSPEETNRVYYERRSGQYHYMSLDNPKSVVTSNVQTAAMVAMFLDRPERHGDGLTTLLSNFGDKLYQMANPKFRHQMHPYYVSGLAAVLYDRWLLTQKDRGPFKQIRGYVLMRLRVSIAGPKRPGLTNAKMVSYCRKIMDVVNDERRWAEACSRAVADVQKEWEQIQKEEKRRMSFDVPRTQPKMAEKLVKRLGGNPQAHAAMDIRRRGVRGTVKSFKQFDFSGQIETENGEIITVYGTDHKVPPERWNEQGLRVWVEVGDDNGPKSTGRRKATKVELDE